jgi:UPF0716 protein FxsA
MFAALAALFLVMSLVEIYVLVQVGQAIGVLNTIGLLIVMSIVGGWLARREGASVFTRLRAQLEAGRMPTNELIDGFLILTGGILLVTPGFVSDALGILLLFPPTRAAARALVKRRFRVQVMGFPGGPGATRGPYRAYRDYRDYGDGPDDVIDV